jgi:hypothetical protein
VHHPPRLPRLRLPKLKRTHERKRPPRLNYAADFGRHRLCRAAWVVEPGDSRAARLTLLSASQVDTTNCAIIGLGPSEEFGEPSRPSARV